MLLFGLLTRQTFPVACEAPDLALPVTIGRGVLQAGQRRLYAADQVPRVLWVSETGMGCETDRNAPRLGAAIC